MLPIFSVYAVRYPGASAALAGVAFGIYALIQCILQIPLGWASDRWGRKPVLLIGLALFSAGSVGCALATDIYGLILARALQGTGAVGAPDGEVHGPPLREWNDQRAAGASTKV